MNKIYIDKKQTIWTRYYFKDNSDIQKIIDALKKDRNDILNEHMGFDFSEDLFETIEDITIDSNKGDSTIAVFQNDKCIWENNDDN